MKITSYKVITNVVQRFLSSFTNHHLIIIIIIIIIIISNVSVIA